MDCDLKGIWFDFHICDIYILVGTEVYKGWVADPFIIETNGESFILKSKMSVFAQKTTHCALVQFRLELIVLQKTL